MKKVLSFLYKYKFIVLSALLGAIAFIFIYGVDIIRPTNTGWILSCGGDITQHYLGWEFYRVSPWTFPIGMMSQAVYPDSISVIFTDSIPFFAVIFKIFSNILPVSFQYIGLYGLICFMLNGITSSIMLKKFIKQDYLVVLLSLFFIVNPIILYRMFYHTALTSHFIIYGAICLLLYKDELSYKKTAILWGALGLIASATHIYLLAMAGIILLGYILYDLLSTKKIKKSIIALVSFLGVAIVNIYILGGFSLATSPLGRSSIGVFNANLNSLINPLNYSTYIERLPYAENMAQEEGFAYLGYGIIIGMMIAVISLIIFVIYRLIKKKKINVNKSLLISLIFISVIAIICATAQKIYYGNTLIYEYEIPDSIQKVVGLFRSNGRFIWILHYIVIITTFFILYKTLGKKLFLIVACFLLLMQYNDLEQVIKDKQQEYKSGNILIYKNKLYDSNWERLFQEDFKNVILTTDFPAELDHMYSIDLLALKYNKKVNRFNIAQNLYDNHTNSRLNEFLTNISTDNLYIIDASAYMKYNSLPLNYYKINGIYVAAAKSLDYLERVDDKNLNMDVNYFAFLNFDINHTYQLIITSEDDLQKGDVMLNGTAFDITNNAIYHIFKEENLYVDVYNGKHIHINVIQLD